MMTFDPHIHIRTVTIVGLGGSGAQIARSAARILFDMRARQMHTPRLVLIDPDTVESHNVGRQLYCQGEVGQPKAHVLMRRFNYALGLDSAAIAEPVDAKRHFGGAGNLVIGAVDNHAARAELNRMDRAMWIDAGNHFASGQVVIGNTDDPALVERYLKDAGATPYLPNAALLFPALLQPEPEPATPPTSCAEHTSSGEQSLFINDWVAVAAAQYLYKLLHRQPITTFLTYVSSDGIGVRSVPIVREELAVFLNGGKA